jgi:hypothetical protein
MRNKTLDFFVTTTRAVTVAEAAELAARFQLPYLETGAKTRVGLSTLFETLATLVGDANPALMRSCQIEDSRGNRRPDQFGDADSY